MVSVFSFLSMIAIFMIFIQMSSSMVVHSRYSPSMDITEEYDEPNYLPRRLAPFFFFSKSSPRLFNRFRLFEPIKRHSFGRKHHWDAFFGRR